MSSLLNMFHVPKQNIIKWRLSGDLKRLTTVTTPDRYPLPHIRDFIMRLQGKIHFPSLIWLNRTTKPQLQPLMDYKNIPGFLSMYEMLHRHFCNQTIELQKIKIKDKFQHRHRLWIICQSKNAGSSLFHTFPEQNN